MVASGLINLLASGSRLLVLDRPERCAPSVRVESRRSPGNVRCAESEKLHFIS